MILLPSQFLASLLNLLGKEEVETHQVHDWGLHFILHRPPSPFSNGCQTEMALVISFDLADQMHSFDLTFAVDAEPQTSPF